MQEGSRVPDLPGLHSKTLSQNPQPPKTLAASGYNTNDLHKEAEESNLAHFCHRVLYEKDYNPLNPPLIPAQGIYLKSTFLFADSAFLIQFISVLVVEVSPALSLTVQIPVDNCRAELGHCQPSFPLLPMSFLSLTIVHCFDSDVMSLEKG
jgi:hypothetical protein